MRSGSRTAATASGVKRQRPVSRVGKRMLGTRDLLCWCHEHLGRDADSPALRGRQDSRLPVGGAVRDVTCETIGMDDQRQPVGRYGMLKV